MLCVLSPVDILHDKERAKTMDPSRPSDDAINLILHWEGIGDIVVCTTILQGLAQQHPGKEVRFYLKGGKMRSAETWLAWAKLGWANSFKAEKAILRGRVYELGNPNDPNNDPERRSGNKDFRHVLWARICETIPLPYKYNLSPGAMERARIFLESMGLSLQRPIVYFSPMTNNVERNWPMKCWHDLEKELVFHTDAQILIGTSRYWEWATEKEFKAFKSPFFLGAEPPDVLVAIMTMVSCIVSNDSGFAHIGGILNIPTIAICGGPYDGEVVFGWYGGVKVVQAPSGDITRVSVKTVFDLMKGLF